MFEIRDTHMPDLRDPNVATPPEQGRRSKRPHLHRREFYTRFGVVFVAVSLLGGVALNRINESKDDVTSELVKLQGRADKLQKLAKDGIESVDKGVDTIGKARCEAQQLQSDVNDTLTKLGMITTTTIESTSTTTVAVPTPCQPPTN